MKINLILISNNSIRLTEENVLKISQRAMFFNVLFSLGIFRPLTSLVSSRISDLEY